MQVNSVQITSVDSLVRPMIPPLILSDYLQEDHILDKVDDFLKCPICFEILKDSKKCKACTRPFCGKCIHQIQVGANKCSHCKIAPFATENLSIFERAKLNEIRFSCFKCNEVYTYEQSAHHY